MCNFFSAPSFITNPPPLSPPSSLTPLYYLSFSVPTDNFGDVLAGYYAKHMGLPVEQLLVATNVKMTIYFYTLFLTHTLLSFAHLQLSFSVPTGNFGDVLAGYYAKRMGLPVEQLLVATNVNDILHRFFETGNYHKADVTQTHSPSMDISISSNFERYLFELAGRDHDKLKRWMTGFEATGELSLEGDLLEKAREDFISGRGDEEQVRFSLSF